VLSDATLIRNRVTIAIVATDVHCATSGVHAELLRVGSHKWLHATDTPSLTNAVVAPLRVVEDIGPAQLSHDADKNTATRMKSSW
jgi:hypothetical protein